MDDNTYILYVNHYSLQKCMEQSLDQIYVVLCPKYKENILSKKCKEMNKHDIYHAIWNMGCHN